MKHFKKIVILLFVLAVCSMTAISAFAANSLGITYEMTINTPELNVSSETQTIVITIEASQTYMADSMTAQLTVPQGVTINSITNTELGFTGATVNTANGMISWYSSGWNDAMGNMDIEAKTIAVYTCTIPANADAGTYEFSFMASSITNNWYTEWERDAIVSATLTIKEAGPACNHPTTKVVTNEYNGTHNVVCADEACGAIVEEKVPCTTKRTHEEEQYPASCCEPGSKYITNYCECGYIVSQGTEKIPATGNHTLVKYDELAATCTTSGHKAYWKCEITGCGYVDEEGKEKIEDLTAWMSEGGDGYIAVDSNNHAGEKSTAYDHIADTWTHTVTVTCLDCNQSISSSTGDCVDNDGDKYCDNCGYFPLCDHSDTTKYTYVSIDKNTHKVICECGVTVKEAENHDYVTDKDGYCKYCPQKCYHDNELVTKTDLGWVYNNDNTHTSWSVCDCGDRIQGSTWECADKDNDGNHTCDTCSNTTDLNEHKGGTATCKAQKVCTECGAGYGDVDPTNHASTELDYTYNSETHSATYRCCGAEYVTDEPHNYTNTPAAYICICGAKFTGWDGDCYIKEAVVQKTGWTAINGAWYYLDTVTGIRAKGMTRVPYPTEPVYGNTYAPNPEDVAYAESKGYTFIDKDEAWFFFGLDSGEFQDATTVFIDNNIIDNNTVVLRYAVKGMIVWHPGYVTYENEFYYFVGDTENGGNKLAQGIVYATRGLEGKYLFEDGQIVDFTGVREGLYFVNGKVAMGAGLVEIEEGKYIYVRSAGQLATGSYWVTAEKANGLVNGGRAYEFDADGYMTTEIDKNGIVDGKYYVEGKLTYAGLIEIEGDYYYVRSNGEIAKGWYYVTKTNGIDLGTTKLYFGEDGKMAPVMNGIVEEGGKLYYYEGNRKACGAGLIEYEGSVYYVRSSGEVQTGYFYISKTNGIEGFNAGDMCKFDESGKLIQNFGQK